MKIVITGAAGFVGRHATDFFSRHGHDVRPLDVDDTADAWAEAFAGCDAVIHLAGSNRPVSLDEFRIVNVGVTERVTSACVAARVRPKVLLSSSTQTEGSSAYGVSKRLAEELLTTWAIDYGAEAIVFRLPNIFGKWGRPDYNSVVATWCHRIARGAPIEVSDPARSLDLLHVDSVIAGFARELASPDQKGTSRFASAGPIFNVTLGRLRDLLESFRDSRATRVIPDLSDPFVAKLHATYMAYLPRGGFAYNLARHADSRGVLAEFLKSPALGQIFVSRTKAGITRGNHYHHSKVEKFLVIEGDAVIRFRDIRSRAVDAYRVSGADLRVLDIPPGWAHHIENVGLGELVVLFWASEPFDPVLSDTYFENVGPVEGTKSQSQESHV